MSLATNGNLKLSSKNNLRRIQDLDAAGLLAADEQRDVLDYVAQEFQIGVSDHVRGLIKTAKNDPVGMQYIPSSQEAIIAPSEMSDPIGDDVYTPVKGVVHRYPDRVLLKATNLCAVYCRYCFRKEMLGPSQQHLSEGQLDEALAYIEANPQVREVILTGGDPLILSARRLKRVCDAIARMTHVNQLRIHTRIPVADPAKITDTHLSVLKKFSKSIQVVIHINHANEISDDMRRKILEIQGSGCLVLSQSVLLKGVNNDPKTLENLFRSLMNMNVVPYYLHHLDRAKGTSHFRVKIEEGMQIMRALQGSISGTMIPKYMLDIPGGYGKVPINKDYVEQLGKDIYRVTDYQGAKHLYSEVAVSGNVVQEVKGAS